MRKLCKLLIPSLISISLGAFNVLAKDSSIQTVSPERVSIASEEYPPFTSQILKHNGIAGHIVTEAFRAEGIELSYQFYPASRAFMLAQYGHVDATVPWAMREGRQKDFIYSDPVIVAGSEHFYFLKKSNFKWDPAKQDYNTLKGFKIGAVKSYDYGKEFQSAEKSGIITVERVSTLEKNFRKLLQGHIQAIISHSRVGMYILQINFSREEIDLIDHQPQNVKPDEYYYLLFSRKKSTSEKLVTIFNKGLQQLKDNGKYAQFLKDLEEGKYSQIDVN